MPLAYCRQICHVAIIFNLILKRVKTYNLTYHDLPVGLFDFDDNTEFTDDDSEGDGIDEIDDDINDSDIDENSAHGAY